ncbi:glycosyltransferase, partial [bacterium]|nr:glycosyltransferase [bacterium]
YRAPILDGTGYAETARNLLIGLIDSGKFDIELDNFDSSFIRADLSEDDVAKIKSISGNKIDKSVGISIQSILAPSWQKFCKKNIGYGVFETDRIPKAWVPYCNSMDAIVSPSEFNKKVFMSRQEMKTPVYVVKNGISKDFNIDVEPIHEFSDKFNIVSVGLVQNRKGFDVILNAFLYTFKNVPNVRLILKIYTDNPSEIDILKNLVADMRRHHESYQPEVIIIGTYLNYKTIARLFKSADLMVTASRGEAWGHAAPQAAAVGATVAVTGWSALSEILPEEVAYHIDYDLIPLPKKSVPHPSFDLADQDGDHNWANPKPESLVGIFNKAYNDREFNKNLGVKGYNHVKDWSWKAASNQLASVIEKVYEG